MTISQCNGSAMTTTNQFSSLMKPREWYPQIEGPKKREVINELRVFVVRTANNGLLERASWLRRCRGRHGNRLAILFTSVYLKFRCRSATEAVRDSCFILFSWTRDSRMWLTRHPDCDVCHIRSAYYRLPISCSKRVVPAAEGTPLRGTKWVDISFCRMVGGN
jgi:hypothetical protein